MLNASNACATWHFGTFFKQHFPALWHSEWPLQMPPVHEALSIQKFSSFVLLQCGWGWMIIMSGNCLIEGLVFEFLLLFFKDPLFFILILHLLDPCKMLLLSNQVVDSCNKTLKTTFEACKVFNLIGWIGQDAHFLPCLKTVHLLIRKYFMEKLLWPLWPPVLWSKWKSACSF